MKEPINIVSEQEIENEVNKRVQFKLDAFFEGMENRIKHNTMSAFSLVMAGDYKNGAKAENYKEAWAQVKAAFRKEAEMSVPHDRMHEKAKIEASRRAIDMLFEQMEVENRGVEKWRSSRNLWLNRIKKAIEEAQNF